MIMSKCNSSVSICVLLTTGFIALHDASLAGYFEYVKALVEAGSDVNAKNNSGVTPLMDACTRGHDDIIDLLLKSGNAVSVKFPESLLAVEILFT